MNYGLLVHIWLQLGLALPAESLVDIKTVDSSIKLDMVYATPHNFVHRRIYPQARCLLRPQVAEALHKAQLYLTRKRPGFFLLLKDCYRPIHSQRRLFKAVVGTAKQKYVANPDKGLGSVHSYGAAVDVTLVDATGRELDMGTPHDFLGPLAEPRREAYFLARGVLTPTQQSGGRFYSISNEWWHFDAARGRALRRLYKPLDLPTAAFRSKKS